MSYPLDGMPEFAPLTPVRRRIVSDELFIAIHDAKGATVTAYKPADHIDSRFDRQLREISTCDLTLPPLLDLDRLPDILPWHHRLSVYDDADKLLWSGPVFDVQATSKGVAVAARDTAAWSTKTRNPITKRWDATDPSVPAGELWDAVVERHGLNVRPILRSDPEGEPSDFAIQADAQLVNETIGQLTDELNFAWSVVCGVPILGPLPKEPVASLGHDDFDGDGLKLIRDGSASVNDMLLRGADVHERSRVDMHGLNLEGIANIDSMFGVSNVRRALRQKLQNTAYIRDVIEVPANSTLRPDAPVSIEQLMPSVRFTVTAFGLRTLVELERVEVVNSGGQSTVRVDLESVREKIELDQLQSGAGTTLGGQRL